MPTISIIIPVYNVERYLKECLDSVIKQTYQDWECILVDDGSLDKSGTICDEYAKIDSRFRIIHKKNGGVSSARNAGLEAAQGEWCTFVDSDDFISPSFIEGLYSPIRTNPNLDFVHGGCINYVKGKAVNINQSYDLYIGDEPEVIFAKFRGLTVSKFFRLNLIKQGINSHDLLFDVDMSIAEDMAFTLDYLIGVKKYAFVPETGYYYRNDNLNSATKSHKIVTYQQALYSFRHLYDATMRYINQHTLTVAQSQLRLQQRGSQLIDTVLSLYNNGHQRSDRIKHLKYDYTVCQCRLLAYAKAGAVKSMLFWFLKHKWFSIFDSLVSLSLKIHRL